MILKPFKVHSPDGKTFYEGEAPQAAPVPQDGNERALGDLKFIAKTLEADGDFTNANRITNAIAALASKAAAIAVGEPTQEIWEYSFIHNSALGRPDEKVGPCLTYNKDQAFDVGCIEQRLISISAPIASASEAVPDVWRTKEFVMSRLIEAAKEPPSSRSVGNSGRPVGDVWRMVLLSDLQEVVHHLKDEATHPTAAQDKEQS